MSAIPIPKSSSRSVAVVSKDSPVSARIAQSLLDLVSSIPPSRERLHDDPDERVYAIVRAAKTKAALASGSLALPPGPLGWLTILPEIYAVWRIQAQLVSDLAALHGRKSQLSREQMLYCLFRHTSAQLFRDLVMRIGERYVVRRLPLRSLYSIANKIGIRITQRSIGRAVSRIVPIAGAIGVGAYTWYDTRQVARTAIKLFRSEIEIKPAIESTATRISVRSTAAAKTPKRAPAKTTARKPRAR